MPKKRSKEEMEVEEDQMDTDDDDDSGDDNESEDEPMTEAAADILSPSPETKKKDMHLRSGKRKRRRSKGTTGLTPPTEIVKKMRTTERKKEPAEEKKGDENHDNDLPAVSSVHSPQANGTAAYPSSAASTVQQQQQAIAAAAIASEGDSSPDSSPEAGRKLFGSTPPPMTQAAVNASSPSRVVTETVETASPQMAATTTTTSPQQQATPPAQVALKYPTTYNSPPTATNGHGAAILDSEWNWGLALFWMVFYSGLMLAMIPYAVDLADVVVPLNLLSEINETAIYAELEQKLLNELPPIDAQQVVVTAQEESRPEISAGILERLQRLKSKRESLQHSKQGIDVTYHDLEQRYLEVHHELTELENAVNEQRGRSQVMAQKIALAVNNQKDLASHFWKEAIEISELPIPDTTLIQIWDIDDPIDCSSEYAGVVAEEEEEAPEEVPDVVTRSQLEQEYEAVLERAQLSVNAVTKDPEAERQAREWIRSMIAQSVKEEESIGYTIDELKSAAEAAPSGMRAGDIGDINELISSRLEMERADKTGQYDHASLFNGGKVIYGGKRGTSRSLVDTLPLYNRVMQASTLRFYGYGPEASILPTWPPDALGQCWSFQAIPLKELMQKRKRSKYSNNNNHMEEDDHKRGSFGTLTISLAEPVLVKSVVIEHPPQGLTDNAESAIRSFRVIGYVDAMATGKSWSLGSFEYDIGNKKSLQEFQVATEIFRAPVPPLQSITLSIDSNWGAEYACLYRFRVHGDLEEE